MLRAFCLRRFRACLELKSWRAVPPNKLRVLRLLFTVRAGKLDKRSTILLRRCRVDVLDGGWGEAILFCITTWQDIIMVATYKIAFSFVEAKTIQNSQLYISTLYLLVSLDKKRELYVCLQYSPRGCSWLELFKMGVTLIIGEGYFRPSIVRLVLYD